MVNVHNVTSDTFTVQMIKSVFQSMIFALLGIKVETVLLVMVDISWLMESALLTIKIQEGQEQELMFKDRQLIQELLQELQDQVVNLQHQQDQLDQHQLDQQTKLPNQSKPQPPPKHPSLTTNNHQPNQETHY